MTAPLPTSAIVGVVGAGAMGAGIAQVAAAGGHTVKLVDKRPQAAANAIDGIRVQLEKLVTRGKLRQESAAAMAGRLIAVQDLCELADCGLVIEAIVEDLHAKQSLYRSLEEVVAPGCIFGTNTSSISVTAIGAALQRPERLAGMHFFNPAPVMALVEIVSGLATDRSVADTLFATAAAWTKTPVHTRSTPGFIVNRVARPYYGEALRLLGERATDCATIDAVMREAGGFRMGPFELMDMIGHDVNFAVTCSVWGAFFNDPRFLPSLIQQELVNAGFLGKKTGRGFFDYREGTLKPTPNTQPQQQRPQAVAVCGDCAVAQALAERLTKAHVRFDRMPYVDGRVAQADDAVIFVTDGRTATQRACDSGINNCVLIDLALDYRTNTRLALTAALQCAPAAAQSATGLLQACGITVSHIADVPGLVVMRTVAMLANEAADAVNQGVCTATAADSAMCLGVNYPKGPLSWADHIGLRKLRDVLSNLGSSYGEDRYRISPLIQRHVYSGTQLHDTHS